MQWLTEQERGKEAQLILIFCYDTLSKISRYEHLNLISLGDDLLLANDRNGIFSEEPCLYLQLYLYYRF